MSEHGDYIMNDITIPIDELRAHWDSHPTTRVPAPKERSTFGLGYVLGFGLMTALIGATLTFGTIVYYNPEIVDNLSTKRICLVYDKSSGDVGLTEWR